MRYKKDAGDAEALVGIAGEWRGIRMEALPKERQVIEFDPASHAVDLANAADIISDAPVER